MDTKKKIDAKVIGELIDRLNIWYYLMQGAVIAFIVLTAIIITILVAVK